MTKREALDELRSYDHAIVSQETAVRLWRAFGLEAEPICDTVAGIRQMIEARGLGGWCNGAPQDHATCAAYLAEQICEKLGGELIGLHGVGSRLRWACDQIAERLSLTDVEP